MYFYCQYKSFQVSAAIANWVIAKQWYQIFVVIGAQGVVCYFV